MPSLIIFGLLITLVLGLAYLLRINHLLNGVPREVNQLVGPRWTTEQLRAVYHELDEQPIEYVSRLLPKLDRRYIVTGGNGLVGGFIVLHLLSRGTPTRNIRILDMQKPARSDMQTDDISKVEYIRTDIRSMTSVQAAFDKPWHPTVSNLPLTVFHTAAVIQPSDRSGLTYGFIESVNVHGTSNVVQAARSSGADVFSSTSSGSINIRPVRPWVLPWANAPRNFWQTLDERDFDQPLALPNQFYSNYARSKAVGERIVCNANSNAFRTGCIRPANGVYGNPTDNCIGAPMTRAVQQTWLPHIVQNFVHGINVAVAHLQHEAVLLSREDVSDIPQAGRPFVVTDPNPSITFGDIYHAISTLSTSPFRTVLVPPVPLLILAHAIECYNILPYRFQWLKKFVPAIKTDVRHLQPAMFSICTHLIASDDLARRPVSQGGLGYEGVITTMQGVVLQILEWNRENAANGTDSSTSASKHRTTARKVYTSSVSAADQLRQATTFGNSANSPNSEKHPSHFWAQ